MIFNFTNNYQFTTRLSLNNENLEVVKSTKLLGVVIDDNLKWDENTDYLIKSAYKRMELLRRVSKFTASKDEKRNIYILYVRSVLEQSCTVWHSSLTEENSNNLERVQKAAIRIILGHKYTDNYETNLMKSDLVPLKKGEKCYPENLL